MMIRFMTEIDLFLSLKDILTLNQCFIKIHNYKIIYMGTQKLNHFSYHVLSVWGSPKSGHVILSVQGLYYCVNVMPTSQIIYITNLNLAKSGNTPASGVPPKPRGLGI